MGEVRAYSKGQDDTLAHVWWFVSVSVSADSSTKRTPPVKDHVDRYPDSSLT